MLSWPANSFLFWLLIGAGIGLFIRFGVYTKRTTPIPRTRFLTLGVLAGLAVIATALIPSLVYEVMTGAGFTGDVVDFVLWGLAATLVLAALILCCWALFADRSRGRKRCPKCWYDLSGAPSSTCPECGKVIATPSRLYRTRRRWSFVALAAIVLLIGASTGIVPKVRNGTWPKLLPDVVIVLSAPFSGGGTALQKEITDRINEEGFSTRRRNAGWLRRTLTDRATRACLRERTDGSLIYRGIALVWDDKRDLPDVRSMIAGHASSTSPLVSRAAVHWLAAHAPDDPESRPILDRALLSGDQMAIRSIVGARINVPPGSKPRSQPVPSRLLELASHPEPLVRLAATRYMTGFREDFELSQWQKRALADESPLVRAKALSRLLFASHRDERVIDAAVDALHFGTPEMISETILALVTSDCQSERLWRAFPGALPRYSKPMQIAQMLGYIPQAPSPVRTDALLRIAENPTHRTTIADILTEFNHFTSQQVARMRELAAQWQAEGGEEAAKAASPMRAAVQHAEESLHAQEDAAGEPAP